MICLTWLFLVAGGVLVMVTLIRWFEQITEAVDRGWWNKVTMLVFMPFTAWFFESNVATGRPVAVPHHEPVRGFGSVPKEKKPLQPSEPPIAQIAPPSSSDQPPPGTPKEFLSMPTIPPKKPTARPAADPEKLAKLRQKMREQGMLPPSEDERDG